MPKDPWRLLRTWDGPPGFNMALDEVLLENRDPRPVLRFYTWSPEALSLGYFQRWRDVAPLAGELALVRRMTGGGAIHHRDELTFSIAAPLDHPLYRGEVRESYLRVHAVIAAALSRNLGIRAEPRGDRRVLSDAKASAMCFHRSTPIDLVWDGAKGVGSAQRRKAGRVLHHGSIKLGSTPLEGPIATIQDHAPEIGAADLAELVLQAMRERLAIEFEEIPPRPRERERALERAEHFGSDAHLRRR